MIYFKMKGGLGNILFEYASALSVESGCVGVLESSCDKRRLEDLRLAMPELQVVPAPPPGVTVYHEPSFAYRPIPAPEGRDLLLNGYFQSERYFDVARVRAALTPSSERKALLREWLGDWASLPDLTSVHVRRGDYLSQPHRHPFVGEGYFRHALARLPEARHCLIFSNDLDWCRDFFPRAFPDRMFRYAEGGTPVDDLHLQSLCRNHVISNSSFSWWGAWLDADPGKRVLAPSHWFGCWMVRHGYDWQDIYAQGTEIVANPPSFVGRLREHVALVKDAFLHRFDHSREGLNGSHLRDV